MTAPATRSPLLIRQNDLHLSVVAAVVGAAGVLWRIDRHLGHITSDRAGVATLIVAVSLRLPLRRSLAVTLGPLLAVLATGNALRTLPNIELRPFVVIGLGVLLADRAVFGDQPFVSATRRSTSMVALAVGVTAQIAWLLTGDVAIFGAVSVVQVLVLLAPSARFHRCLVVALVGAGGVVLQVDALPGHDRARPWAVVVAVALAVSMRLPLPRRWAMAVGLPASALVVAAALITLPDVGLQPLMILVAGTVLADVATFGTLPWRGASPTSAWEPVLLIGVAAQVAWRWAGAIAVVSSLLAVEAVAAIVAIRRGRASLQVSERAADAMRGAVHALADRRHRAEAAPVVEAPEGDGPDPGDARTGEGRPREPLAGIRPVVGWLVRHGDLVAIVTIGVAWLLVFPTHIANGGFTGDDWVDAFQARMFPDFWNAVEFHQAPNRFAWSVLSTYQWRAVGIRPRFYLGETALLSLVQVVLLYRVARRLRVDAVPAAGIALIVLLSPTIAAGRFYGVGANNALAVTLCLAGLLLAFRGLEVGGLAGAALHGVAVVLYVTSALTYEVTVSLILGAGLLYLVIGPRARVWRRWAVDLVAVAVVVVRTSGNSPVPADHGLVHAFRHADILLDGSLEVAPQVIWPGGLAFLLAVMAGVLVVAFQRSVDPDASEPERAVVRSPLTLAASGIVIVAVGYLVFLPSDYGYRADNEGIESRINAIAVIGYAALAVGVAMLVGAALSRIRPGATPATAKAVGLVVLAILVVRTLQADVEEQARWEHAGRDQREILATLDRLIPHLAEGSTVYTFGASGNVAPALAIFGGAGTGDLNAAFRVTRNDLRTQAFPVYGGMEMQCRRHDVVLPFTSAPNETPYGKAYFVDLIHERVYAPEDRTTCRALVEQLPMATTNESEPHP